MPYYIGATIVPWYREEQYAEVRGLMTDVARELGVENSRRCRSPA